MERLSTLNQLWTPIFLSRMTPAKSVDSSKASWDAAALITLSKYKVPFHYRALASLILKQGLVVSSNKTPWEPLGKSLRDDPKFFRLNSKTPVYGLLKHKKRYKLLSKQFGLDSKLDQLSQAVAQVWKTDNISVVSPKTLTVALKQLGIEPEIEKSEEKSSSPTPVPSTSNPPPNLDIDISGLIRSIFIKSGAPLSIDDVCNKITEPMDQALILKSVYTLLGSNEEFYAPLPSLFPQVYGLKALSAKYNKKALMAGGLEKYISSLYGSPSVAPASSDDSKVSVDSEGALILEPISESLFNSNDTMPLSNSRKPKSALADSLTEEYVAEPYYFDSNVEYQGYQNSQEGYFDSYYEEGYYPEYYPESDHQIVTNPQQPHHIPHSNPIPHGQPQASLQHHTQPHLLNTHSNHSINPHQHQLGHQHQSNIPQNNSRNRQPQFQPKHTYNQSRGNQVNQHYRQTSRHHRQRPQTYADGPPRAQRRRPNHQMSSQNPEYFNNTNNRHVKNNHNRHFKPRGHGQRHGQRRPFTKRYNNHQRFRNNHNGVSFSKGGPPPLE